LPSIRRAACAVAEVGSGHAEGSIASMRRKQADMFEQELTLSVKSELIHDGLKP
jgi:hypothetical protein